MPRVDLNSTLLPAATYQDQSIFLELEFRSGAIYRYLAVPAQTYQELLRAESQGRYFNQHIGIASLRQNRSRAQPGNSRYRPQSGPRVISQGEDVN
jgi:KTSC domain-containing protein